MTPMPDTAPMPPVRFFDAPLDFIAQPAHAQATFVAASDEIDAAHWRAFAVAAHAAGRRLVALWASDEGGGTLAVWAAYDLVEGLACVRLSMRLPAPPERPSFPDLGDLFPAAERMQRAAQDLVGVEPASTDPAWPTDTRPWLRHANWPQAYHPLRKTAADERFACANEQYAFVRVEGDGVHEIPVGPIHAGIIEPGHFRFSVMGERVLRLEERLGWKHKGIERRFVGMTLADGARLAGRISGDSTVAYAWAYAQAAEAIADCAPPPRALWLRALLLERERVANHLGDLGYLGNDVALAFGLAQFLRLREDWSRLNAQLFGHRLLMDRIVPGGVASDLSAEGADAILAQGAALEHELRTLKSIYDEHAGLQDRFLTTGRIVPELAVRLGLCGIAARASAQALDLRVQHPAAPYPELAPQIAVERNGDVAARALVRFAEVKESLRLIRRIVEQLPAGEIRCDARSAPGRRGFGWVEGWRGDVLVALETGLDGRLSRAHAHDPSWQNWPALEHAVIDNIVPDFPLINKSFNLSYAGQDL